jgi:hypothetical protein
MQTNKKEVTVLLVKISKTYEMQLLSNDGK